MNKYLSYDAERAPKVRAMFSRLAWKYDLVNDVMSFGLHRAWKRQTVAIAAEGTRGGGRWLDLCCGTGDMSFLAEAAAARGTRVVGADFTLPMLAVARQRKAAGRATAGDSLRRTPFASPFRTGRFDADHDGYGLRNIADPEAGLAEMRRVLAPGGRAVILDFGKPGNPVAAALYGASCTR